MTRTDGKKKHDTRDGYKHSEAEIKVTLTPHHSLMYHSNLSLAL